jgi:hypothetical protein
MQPFQKAACALFFAAALGGCAIGTKMDNGPTVMPELRTTKTSPRSETLTASKDSIIYSEELGARHGAKLLKGVSGSYLPDDKITFIETHFDAPAGLELVAMTGAPVPMYCSLEPIFPLSVSACFFDTKRDGTFNRIRPNGNRVDYFTKIGAMGMAIDPIPYEKKEPATATISASAITACSSIAKQGFFRDARPAIFRDTIRSTFPKETAGKSR